MCFVIFTDAQKPHESMESGNQIIGKIRFKNLQDGNCGNAAQDRRLLDSISDLQGGMIAGTREYLHTGK